MESGARLSIICERWSGGDRGGAKFKAQYRLCHRYPWLERASRSDRWHGSVYARYASACVMYGTRRHEVKLVKLVRSGAFWGQANEYLHNSRASSLIRVAIAFVVVRH